MLSDLFAKEKINTGRQKEADLLKAFSIFMMILTHCIDEFLKYGDGGFPYLINDVLAQTVGAQGFMLCMGIGVTYGRKCTSAEYLKRGTSLLVTGQVLNLLRYALPALITYAVTGNETARSWCFLTFSSDIMQFAGLFFVILALMRRLNFGTGAIFGTSAVLSLLATFSRGFFHTGIYAVDQFLGLFLFTESESYFPLFHWMIYPAAGMLFAKILLHVRDKKKFYSLLLIPAGLVTAVYFYVGLCVDQPLFTVFDVWQSICYVNLLEALAQICACILMISVFFFVAEGMSEKAFRPVAFVSKNINRYYCVHSVMIYTIYFILFFSLHGGMESEVLCYLTTLGIFLLTSLLVLWYDRKWLVPVREFIGKHRILLYGIVLLLTVGVCVFGSIGISEFPNLWNGYLEG